MRMLTITTALLGLAAVSAPALAAPGDRTFEHDGNTYVYHVENKGELKLIAGKTYPSGESFSFVVRGDRVNGQIGARNVSFSLNDVQPGVAGEIKVSAR